MIDIKSLYYNRGNLCYDLKINVTYSEDKNAFEFVSSFFSLGESFGHAHRYLRAQKGRKPKVDAIFDNPEKARQVASEAKELFTRELGHAIGVAIDMLSQDIAQRVGIVQTTPGKRGDQLAKAWKKDRRNRLQITQGRKLDPDFLSKRQEAIQRLKQKKQRTTYESISAEMGISRDDYSARLKRRRRLGYANLQI
ncbi:MAG TPA: hypothetical protein VIX17_00750 [Pyrinomonadaceae bacterium]|jgi:predicted NBD/HSP70 family sugar kinase